MISKTIFTKRLFTSLLVIIFFLCAILGKLIYIQIIDGGELQAKALDQWTRDIPLKAERGYIYDTNGDILVGTSTSYTLYVRPVNVEDKEYLATVVSQATGISRERILEKLNVKGQSEITLCRKITKECKNQIIESGVEGVYFSKDIERYYPYGDFASALIGFCNIDTEGQSGLELYYNDYLKGVDGEQLTETDIVGRELTDNIYYLPSVDGFNLSLTIDRTIQSIVEGVLQKAYSKYEPKSASCLVMNVQTGGITAIAQKPSFDLNNIDRTDTENLFKMSKLSAISDVFEMGSVFKIITIAAAIEEGVVSESERFYCSGSRIVDGKKIRCWKTRGHGSQTFAEGVENSCNCVFMDLALRVGAEKMYSYYEKFNLTCKTGIDFSGEGSGLLIPLSSVKNVDLARMGFGQAIAVTPIGLVSAVSAIIGGGVYKVPYVLDKTTDYQGNLVYHRMENNQNRLVSESTSEIVRRLLLGVVDNGSGRLAGVDGYGIGGKTGTAQKYKDGTIDRGKYISSFIGYSTYDNPKYVVYLYVDEPSGYLYYGSQVAAPLVGEIFEGIFNYENTPLERTKSEVNEISMPDFTGMTYEQAKLISSKVGLYMEVEGEGIVVSQFPYAGTLCNDKSVIFLQFE